MFEKIQNMGRKGREAVKSGAGSAHFPDSRLVWKEDMQKEASKLNPTEFQAAVERHKAALMRTAARSNQPENAVGTPITLPADDNAVVNPPEVGPGREPLQDYPQISETYAAFRAYNTESGFLCVQAFAGPQTIPVSGAQVLVTRDFTDGTRRFAAGQTDESGVLDGIVLPAPPGARAQAPGNTVPYALYDIRVSHPDYRTEIYQQVPVFEGVKSIQPVRFLSSHTGM